MEVRSSTLNIQTDQNGLTAKNVDASSDAQSEFLRQVQQRSETSTPTIKVFKTSNVVSAHNIKTEPHSSSHEIINQRIDAIEVHKERQSQNLTRMNSPSLLKNSPTVTVTDLQVGKNESLGNDMVLMKFNDGSLRQTQKALFEAADKLGVFERVHTSLEFANWHLNEWAPKVTTDTTYFNAHVEFNDAQKNYDAQLKSENPEIIENRLAFSLQSKPNLNVENVASEVTPEAFNESSQTIVNVTSPLSENYKLSVTNLGTMSADISIESDVTTDLEYYTSESRMLDELKLIDFLSGLMLKEQNTDSTLLQITPPQDS